MKKVVLLVAAILFGFSATAMAEKDHWATGEECVSAQGAPFYYPFKPGNLPLENGEVVGGFSNAKCVEMILPDRLGGRGWVRIGEDRKIVFEKTTGKAKRLMECTLRKQIFAVIALPIVQAKNGEPGAPGAPGEDGLDGEDGRDGVPGKDGYTPIKNVDYFDGKPGPPGQRGLIGLTGHQGAPAPLSWGQEHPWIKGALIVTGIVAAILICRNNCAHWLGLESAAPAAAPAAATPAAGIPPSGWTGPAFLPPGGSTGSALAPLVSATGFAH